MIVFYFTNKKGINKFAKFDAVIEFYGFREACQYSSLCTL